MAERKCLQLFMGVVCFVAVAVAQNVNVRMPRKNVLSLTDFANVSFFTDIISRSYWVQELIKNKQRSYNVAVNILT